MFFDKGIAVLNTSSQNDPKANFSCKSFLAQTPLKNGEWNDL